MLSRIFALIISLAAAGSASVISDVRGSIARNDFAGASEAIRSYRAARGVTPEMLEALSWMARGARAQKNYAEAGKYAEETYQLSVAELKKRPLDQEKNLPIALGAAIEVEGNVLRSEEHTSELQSRL